jgi:hypothetical protein
MKTVNMEMKIDKSKIDFSNPFNITINVDGEVLKVNSVLHEHNTKTNRIRGFLECVNSKNEKIGVYVKSGLCTRIQYIQRTLLSDLDKIISKIKEVNDERLRNDNNLICNDTSNDAILEILKDFFLKEFQEGVEIDDYKFLYKKFGSNADKIREAEAGIY